MMIQDLILFPFGGNAREAIATIEAVNSRIKKWHLLGFIDDDRTKWNKKCCGYAVLGGGNVLNEHPRASVLAVPGNPESYLKRKTIIEGLKIKPDRFATIIHPAACISPDAVLGNNLVIMPNVIISSGVLIGNHCIILPNSVIAHDSQIGDFCCIGSNVAISGNVRIETECYVGSGSSIIDNVTIGRRTLIGLGSNVIHDIAPGLVVAGNPAKILRRSDT